MADFRAIYHMPWQDALSLPAPAFFALANRLTVYAGVIQMRAESENRKSTRNVKHGAKIVESERESIESDPLLAGLIDYG